jgi:hypothetical protein
MSLMLLFQSILLSIKIIYKSYYNLFWAKNVVVLLLYFCITLSRLYYSCYQFYVLI